MTEAEATRDAPPRANRAAAAAVNRRAAFGRERESERKRKKNGVNNLSRAVPFLPLLPPPHLIFTCHGPGWPDQPGRSCWEKRVSVNKE
jgi:hypothetical protein